MTADSLTHFTTASLIPAVQPTVQDLGYLKQWAITLELKRSDCFKTLRGNVRKTIDCNYFGAWLDPLNIWPLLPVEVIRSALFFLLSI